MGRCRRRGAHEISGTYPGRSQDFRLLFLENFSKNVQKLPKKAICGGRFRRFSEKTDIRRALPLVPLGNQMPSFITFPPGFRAHFMKQTDGLPVLTPGPPATKYHPKSVFKRIKTKKFFFLWFHLCKMRFIHKNNCEWNIGDIYFLGYFWGGFFRANEYG